MDSYAVLESFLNHSGTAMAAGRLSLSKTEGFNCGSTTYAKAGFAGPSIASMLLNEAHILLVSDDRVIGISSAQRQLNAQSDERPAREQVSIPVNGMPSAGNASVIVFWEVDKSLANQAFGHEFTAMRCCHEDNT